MKKAMRLDRSALRQLEAQYYDVKQKAAAAYKVWSELSTDERNFEGVLARNGVKIKKDEKEESKSSTATGSAATLRAAIGEILKSEGQAMKASVIREKLKHKKIAFRPAYFWRVIGRMEGKGKLKKVGTGMYELVNGAS